FACVEGIGGAEQGKEEEDKARFGHGACKAESSCFATLTNGVCFVNAELCKLLNMYCLKIK
ncbi:MAG: hypothetical protein IIV41_03185, partial [Akkermansia sp.]|nr:hypothetical protein [Akkermansia sp.]